MSAVPADPGPARGEPAATYYTDLVRIPGMGDPPDRCRGLSPVGFCGDGHVQLGRSSCGTRYCPDHWRDWLEEAVISIVARLGAYREAVDGAERRLSHVVVSPPTDRRYSVRRLWSTRSEAYEVAEAAGLRGGAAIVHPYRPTERANRMHEVADEYGATEGRGGKWRFLWEATDGWDDLAEYLEPSPHYHMLAAGPDVEPARAPDGWIVERVRSLSRWHRNDVESYRDMVRVAYYLLTHAGVQRDRQATTYFGDVSTGSFNPVEELSAVAWQKIQRMAEQAVKGEESDPTGVGLEECAREECEEPVRPLADLGEWLDREDWVDRVRLTSGGHSRYLRLLGAYAWSEGLTDRPPPGARRSPEPLLAWLEERGRYHAPAREQSRLRSVAG